MLNPLITAFHSLDLDPTAEELADVLWLALQMRRAKPLMPLSQRLWLALQIRMAMLLRPLFQRLKNSPSIKPPLVLPKETDHPEKTQTDTATTDDSFPLYPSSAGKKTGSGLPFRTPAARMLPHTLSLARALRPLMQRVASRTVYQINEAATIEWIAETQIWLPVLQGIPERRFEMALVIENSSSMEIWPPVIAEFRRLLENHGAFRDVQTWELKSEEGKVHLYAKSHSTTARSRHRKELLDSIPRRLILVVSDCVSSAWYTGEMTKLLECWGPHHPVAILQMLPQRLWRGTGLSQALRVNLRATVANVTNRRLGDDAAESWLEDNIPKGIKMPVVTLETESLNYWAKLVMGKGENWVQGVIFEPSTVKLEREVTATTAASTLTATERVKRFNALASPLAQQLAGYLAAAPLTLEVMRLVQQVMLPASGQIHLAEVFLGGLLKRENVTWVKYDFHDGVREILLDARSVLEGIEVLKVVSEYIKQRLGGALDFGAWLENPAGVEGRLDEESRPFAMVAAGVLRRLGGEYAQLALRAEVEKGVIPSWLIGSWKGHWNWKNSTRNTTLIFDVNNPRVATMIIRYQKSGVETIVEQRLQVELKNTEVHLRGTDYKFIELGNAINVWRLDTFKLKVTSDRNCLEGILSDDRQIKVEVYFIRESSPENELLPAEQEIHTQPLANKPTEQEIRTRPLANKQERKRWWRKFYSWFSMGD